MMSLRVLSLLVLVACAAAASIGDVQQDGTLKSSRWERAVSVLGAPLKGSKDQSFNIGGIYQYDRQLSTQTVYKSSTIFTVHKEYLEFSSYSTIHCIQIVDNLKNGKNAEVTVQKGGVGQKNVSIRFKSQRGEKINYLVIIWGQ